MIAKLRGILDSSGDDWIIIDVQGVGYLAWCSARTLGRIPARGEPVTLLIETVVREDSITLYGFMAEGERDWFRLLQTVQGVGARVAMAVLSVLTPDELAQAIAVQDKTALTRASGVGKKLAERMINELKDKVGSLAAAATTAALATDGKGAAPLPDGSGELADAVSALTNLGYRPADAYTAVAKAARDLGAEADLARLIKAGLKELAR